MANRRFIDFPIATTVGDNDIVLIWQDGANKQTTKATILSGLPENLEDLNDVVISGLTNGQILRYDSVTGKWENTDQGNLDLNDLNDVSIVSPSNGQVLVYNSSTSKWENSSAGFVPYTGAVTTVNLGAQTIQAGQFVKAGGTSSQFLKADGSIDSTAYGTGSVTSVALTMPSAFNVANSPITTAGTLAVTGAGTVGQYIRGDGSLADFPQASGGGSSVSYYLNGSVNQGTIGGVDYRELSKVPILGAGTQFSINANGYIAQFLTDAGDPNLLEIPGGNWNFETYFSASSGGGTPTFYVELYKYDGTTFTLIASSSTAPEFIAFGTNLTPYYSTLAVPTTTLALTDRLAVRYYVTHSGRTITMHTENNTLCQIVTTFTTGLTSLNGLTAQVQNLAVGTSGSDFNIVSATATHTFNLPTASATNRGALSSADWTIFNNKQNALGYVPVPETRTLTINGVTQDLSANRTFNVGTVTSVGLSSATSGVTIGSTPVTSSGTITLAIATASGSQNGLLSSTDWTTFNNKQNALTNPVTGTGASGQVAYFNGTTTITSESNLFWDATNDRLGIGTSSPTERLTLHRDGATGVYAHWRNNSNANNAYIGITGTGLMQIQNNGNIDFYTGASYNNQMTLAGTGNLIIGNPGSDNGARLQVSGTATVSGALNGTSASFTGVVTFASGSKMEGSGAPNFVLSSTSAVGSGAGPYQIFKTNNSDFGYIGSDDALLSTTGNRLALLGLNGLIFRTGASYLPSLTLASTGAATFSSSVTAANFAVGAASNFNAMFYTVGAVASYIQLANGSTGAGSANGMLLGVDGSGNGIVNVRGAVDYITSVAGLERFRISSTGAANFSNSLRIQGSAVPASGSGTELAYDGTNGYLLAFNRTSSVYLPLFVQGSSLSFGTGDGTTKMLINSSGNVGIGTATFAYSPRLAVASVGQNSIAIQTTDVVQGSTGTVLYIGTGASTGNSTYGIIRALGNGGTAATNLVLQESGNVLIGTTTDNGARLQVSGDASINGLTVGRGSGNINSNTIVGNGAGNSNTSGSSNSFFGRDSGFFNTSGNRNCSFGQNAGAFQTIGNNNLFFGFDSGRNIANGSNLTESYDSIFIGLGTRADGNGQVNQIVIGHNAVGNGSNTVVLGNSSISRTLLNGNVLIGTTTDNGYRLRVEAQSGGPLIWFSRGSANAQFFMATDNSIYLTTGNNLGVGLLNGATSWSSFSDIRLKNVTGKIENSLDAIKSLNAIKYTLKTDLTNKQRVGLIAQEVQKILPESVDKDENGMLQIRYSELIPLIVKAIQELNEKIK